MNPRIAVFFLWAFASAGSASAAVVSSNASLGSFFGVPGLYAINTDTLAMSGPEGFLATGVVDNGRVVFQFDDFLLLPGSTIRTAGALPVEIASNSEMMIAGEISAFSGGFAGGSFGQTGLGPGGGGRASSSGGGGGGFGGAGGRGHSSGGAGGATYGSILTALTALQGGSGGGGTTGFFGGRRGGDGGGALILRSAERMSVFGNVSVDGQNGAGGGSGYGGGGGSGGGLILSAPEIVLAATVSARGGRGGEGTFDNGGGGGGGRILIETSPNGFLDYGTITVDGGRGGSSFFGSGGNGMPGTITFQTVPEPSAAVLTLLVALVGFARVPAAKSRSD